MMMNLAFSTATRGGRSVAYSGTFHNSSFRIPQVSPNQLEPKTAKTLKAGHHGHHSSICPAFLSHSLCRHKASA